MDPYFIIMIQITPHFSKYFLCVINFQIGLLLTTLAFINTGATGDEDEEDLM